MNMFHAEKNQWRWLIGCFMVLNTLLYLPQIILSFPSLFEIIIPYKVFWQDSIVKEIKGVFLHRRQVDIWRLSIDLLAMVSLLWLVRNRTMLRSLLWRLLFVIYLGLLCFNVYFISFTKFFHGVSIVDDIQHLSLVWVIFENDLTPGILMGLFGALLVLFGLYRLFKQFSESIFSIRFERPDANSTHTRFSKTISYVFIGLSAFGVWHMFFQAKHDLLMSLETTVHPSAYRFYENLRTSIRDDRFEELRAQVLAAKSQKNNEVRFDRKPPNIFMIFVESYGEVITGLPELKAHFDVKLEEVGARLKENNWSVYSNLSKSTIVGGNSWLAYTSFLYGFEINKQRDYKRLQRIEEVADYPSIPNIAIKSGYKNYRLSSIYAQSVGLAVPYFFMDRLYGIDEWIKLSDMAYTGPMFGFGPAPYDQFALNFAAEKIRKQQKGEPFSLFFITQNSHSPFVPDLEVADDWRTLSDGSHRIIKKKQNTNFFQLPKMESYISSIDYQLDFISDYIVKYGTEDDLFILVGDHQPPVVAPHGVGMETPVHIVSKNNQFVSSFSEYGFVDGMRYRYDAPVTHYGLHHAFLREMVKHYSNGNFLPPYLPNGSTAQP